MNNTTKRALFNARRRYNNARARANALPNSDPEAKERALNNIMAAAANYLTAVRGSSAVMPRATAPTQASIRNRMRTAITRRYNYNRVSNNNVEAFLAGHMEYNDPEINALYKEYQAMQNRRRGGRRRRRTMCTRKRNIKQYGGNGNNNNNFNTEAWQINVSPKEVLANHKFIEGYKETLAAKQEAMRNLIKKYRALQKNLQSMTPGSQEYMRAHEELEQIDNNYRELTLNTMAHMPMMRATLVRNLSFAERPPKFEVSFAGRPVAGETLTPVVDTLAAPTIRAEGVSDGLYTITIWDADAASPGYLHLMAANLSPVAGVISLPADAIYRPPTPPSGVHRYFVTLWKQLRPAVKEYRPGPFAKDTLLESGRQVAETFFRVAADS